ncbi:MAG TPA: hypothetical protein VH255_03160 [Verrucomicrobiae bacterium]|nr:hypothetical protein [Verrucomicrobiae bacterium]
MAVFLFIALFGLCSCKSIAPLPPVNLSEPGWKTQQGQVVWTPKRNAPEIVGDVMVATQPDGRAFIQFTKTPLPIITAQKTQNKWSLEVPLENKRYAYPGKPPERILWFQLAKHSAGGSLTKPWKWTDTDGDGWRIENISTGESVEGSFNP